MAHLFRHRPTRSHGANRKQKAAGHSSGCRGDRQHTGGSDLGRGLGRDPEHSDPEQICSGSRSSASKFSGSRPPTRSNDQRHHTQRTSTGSTGPGTVLYLIKKSPAGGPSRAPVCACLEPQSPPWLGELVPRLLPIPLWAARAPWTLPFSACSRRASRPRRDEFLVALHGWASSWACPHCCAAARSFGASLGVLAAIDAATAAICAAPLERRRGQRA